MCPVCHIANVNSGVHLVTLVQACLLQQMQLHLKLGSNSCMSLGKGGTHTKSLMGPHKKSHYTVLDPGILGGQFINEESACPP